MAGILSIGVTGMQAAWFGMMTTQHNITNARTAGYNRQQIVQGTNKPGWPQGQALSGRAYTSRPFSACTAVC